MTFLIWSLIPTTSVPLGIDQPTIVVFLSDCSHGGLNSAVYVYVDLGRGEETIHDTWPERFR